MRAWWILGLVMAASSGCNQAKPPEQVAKDVAAAEEKAAAKVADARQDAEKNSADAAAEAAQNAKDLKVVNAQGAYDLALAKADGDHKVESQKCLSSAGDLQKACKDKADATYALAKANAASALAEQKQ